METKLPRALGREPVVSRLEAENNANLDERLMSRSPFSTVHGASPEMQLHVNPQWHLTRPARGLPTPESLWWEADVPVAAQSLVLTVHNEPGRFVITELYGIAQAGHRDFVLAASGNGKPLYGAFVMSLQGQPCLLQLFEFVQTAINTGWFQPIPTVGGLIQGAYTLEYARLRVPGTISSLPPLVRWAPCLSSACITVMPWLPLSMQSSWGHLKALESVPPANDQPHTSENPIMSQQLEPSKGGTRCCLSSASLPIMPRLPLVQSSRGQLTAIDPVPPTNDQVHTCEDSIMGHQSEPSEGKTPEVNEAIVTAAPPSNNVASQLHDDAEEELEPVPSSSAPSATNLGNVAAETAATHSEGVQSGGADAVPPATHESALRAPIEPEPVLGRCFAWSLCSACDQFWGIPALEEKHFTNARFQGSPTCDEDTPAVLCSEKTSARKCKRKQKRHGPKSKTSEYCGVILYKRTDKWEAHIWYQGSQVYLGASITKIHAAQVYDRAALYLFGPDADINFKPEGYQEEYDFMQRLSHTQMVAYLRRESRQTGEEAKYPGVTKEKVGGYAASYRPRKDKESHEPIGTYPTEEEAVRAILKEALNRRNYEMVEKILDIRHLRTVKPAPGKIKQKRKVQNASGSVAKKVVTAKLSKKRTGRARRSSGMASPAMQPQADAPPAQEAGRSSSKRQNKRKAAKSKLPAASLDNATTSMPIDLPINQTERTSRKRKSSINSNSAPDAKKSASCSAHSSRDEELLQEPDGVAEEAPSARSATLRVYLPRKSRSRATRLPRHTPAHCEMLPTATPESLSEAQVGAPTSPAASPETVNQSLPAVYDNASGSSSGPQIGSGYTPTQRGVEGQSSGSPESFLYESAGAIPDGSGLSYETGMEGLLNLRELRTVSSKSSRVIRPVARRLALRTEFSDGGDNGHSWKSRLYGA